MGSSYVEFRGHGFWSWGGYLEHFLAGLAEEVSGAESVPEWLADAATIGWSFHQECSVVRFTPSLTSI